MNPSHQKPLVTVEAPDSLVDWSAAGLTPRPRDEREEFHAVQNIEQVLGNMLNNGKALALKEFPIILAMYEEADLKQLAYRPIEATDRKAALDAVARNSKSVGEELLGRLSIDCIHEIQTPGSVDWRETRELFANSWPQLKSELVDQDPDKRQSAQAMVRFALDRVRLPSSVRGELSIVSDMLRPRVVEALGWSQELDK